MVFTILAINPGSTSTKIGVFHGKREIFSINVTHEAECLAGFGGISAQLAYRKQTVLNALEKAGVDLSSMDAFVGRGGGLLSVEGGVYEINDILLADATRGANGIQHPAQLGPQLAYGFALQYGKPCFILNPPDTDELTLCARMTGVKGIYRNVHLHALNMKETAIRHSIARGRTYESCNYIGCHVGGGISVSAHERGRMIDGFDTVGGEGPMTPTRCGALPVSGLIDYSYSHDQEEIKSLCTHSGGFVSHLGTSNAREVLGMIEQGDKYAALVWDTMVYQIIRCIGAMAGVLHGKVDGILLSGGMAHSAKLTVGITEACSWIAPVYVYAGEFELEAMAAGAARVLSGEETAKVYTGRPVWTPEEIDKQG
ncbi:MAG: butyrate kinase [Christensenellales bacterium]|jgi:butyrate kinase